MKAYREFTIVVRTKGSYEPNGTHTPGTESTFTVCGASAPVNKVRNRQEMGSNITDEQNFWFFTDTWGSAYVVLDKGREYTTQNHTIWPRIVEVNGLAEVP